MKRLIFVLAIIIPLTPLIFLPKEEAAISKPELWSIEAVDTMKYSRDPSREKLNDQTFDIVIATQVQNIARMGVTHVAIATPYDEEFLPILNRWVEAARKNHLNVWFRGNFSGWEGWFGYPKMSRMEHIKKTREFILKHPDLFADGDIFMGCPECENGGLGDPRRTGDVVAYRQFLIDEHTAMKSAFAQIGKKVNVNLNSMNGDVARLVMDKKTTKALGGFVVIDHYVRTPLQLASDIKQIADDSGGKVVLGEFGVPILDIHGKMTEDAQADWIGEALTQLVSVPELTGINYWVNVGGSTTLYNDDGSARKAVSTLTSFFKPQIVKIRVFDPLGGEIRFSSVNTLNRAYAKSNDGIFVPFVEPGQRAIVSASGYETKFITFSQVENSLTVVLTPKKENAMYMLKKLLKSLFRI